MTLIHKNRTVCCMTVLFLRIWGENHSPVKTGFQFNRKRRYIYNMEEIIKQKIITGYADRSLQDINDFINGIQMENLITLRDAKSLMSWADDYKRSH